MPLRSPHRQQIGWCGLEGTKTGHNREAKLGGLSTRRAASCSDLAGPRAWGRPAAPKRPVARPYSALPSARTQQIRRREVLRSRVARAEEDSTGDTDKNSDKENGSTSPSGLTTRRERPRTANPVMRPTRRRPLAILQQPRSGGSTGTALHKEKGEGKASKREKSNKTERTVRRPRTRARSRGRNRARSRGRNRGANKGRSSGAVAAVA